MISFRNNALIALLSTKAFILSVASSSSSGLRGGSSVGAEDGMTTVMMSTTPGEVFSVQIHEDDLLTQGSQFSTDMSVEANAGTWTDGHNTRRQTYHKQLGGSYKSLTWDDALSSEVMTWLNTLSQDSCEKYHHDPDSQYGENLAVIWGADSIDRVMTAWVEDEYYEPTEPYKSGHGHMTQALWWPSAYVGCAQVNAKSSSGGDCIIYGCRYAKPGNCNLNKFSSWSEAVMADDSPCKPDCPSDMTETSPNVCENKKAILDVADNEEDNEEEKAVRTVPIKVSTTPGEFFTMEMEQSEVGTLTNDISVAAVQQQWMDGHNSRRQKYHKQLGGSYVSLAWDDSLASETLTWLNTLNQGYCEDYNHDPNNRYGENLAVIWGADSIDRVMTAWVENEYYEPTEPYKSGHGHMTQALWHPSTYVGCSQVNAKSKSGGSCIIYGCRYAKPGNCNLKKYSSWSEAVMAQDSPCKPNCPSDMTETSPNVCVNKKVSHEVDEKDEQVAVRTIPIKISTTPGQFFTMEMEQSEAGAFSNELSVEAVKQEWMDGHNSRRQKYHQQLGGSYVSLTWNDSLVSETLTWLNTLNQGYCDDYHHDPNNRYGENLAVIWGADSIDRVMTAWVENEYYEPTQPYQSGHGHMTQALWHPSTYVGCTQVSGTSKSGGSCIIYGCRYAKPGNCNLNKYSSWSEAVMAQDSPCKPNCPSDMVEVSPNVCKPKQAFSVFGGEEKKPVMEG